MAENFRLSVVTGEGTVLEDTVSYVNLPTTFGSVGILADHAPMLCAVCQGVNHCTRGGETLRIRVSSGVASVDNNEVTVLISDGKVLEE